MIHYRNYNVLDGAIRRIKKVFDLFDKIFISVSSGKDSTCLYHLCLEEAKRRNRRFNLFFLDQEAEYQGSIDLLREMMSHPLVNPFWFQVPIDMTNATSFTDTMLHAWEPGKKWIREKETNSIQSIDKKYPKRFYGFFDWFERQQNEPTAFMIGLRSKESLNRFRAVTSNPGFNRIPWSTNTKSKNSWRFYPIYDWTFGDVWKYISDNKIKYNPVYDKMYCLKGKRLNDIRISNLIHEKSFTCLAELQEIEPETYERLCERLNGVHAAAIYAREKMIYNSDLLPPEFKSWKDYRDYLLVSSPIAQENRDRFKKRFGKQKKSDMIYRQQCRQVLLCDYENNIPVNQKADKVEFIRKWWDKL